MVAWSQPPRPSQTDLIETSQRYRTFTTRTINNPYTRKQDNAEVETTRNTKGLERYQGFKRKKGTTLQQEKQRNDTMEARKLKRAGKLITAEILKQMTLDDYQRKYNKIAPERTNVAWGNSILSTLCLSD